MLGRTTSPAERTLRIAGSIVRLGPATFTDTLANEPVDLVIVAPKYLFRWSFAGDGCFRSGWQSLAVSRGIVFYTTSTEKPAVRAEIKVIDAEDVWVSFLGSMKP